MIPTTLDEIGPEWLTGVLEEPVATAEVVTIAKGEGFMGQLARIRLTYGAGASPDAPASLIVKLPTTEPGNRMIGQMMRLWEREHRFYAELAPRVGVRVPAVFANLGDAESGSYALVLEDLAGMTANDQVSGASIEQATTVVDQLAALHAAWWDSPELADLHWMPDLHDPMINSVTVLFDAGWPAFRDRYWGRLPERVFGWAERFVTTVPEWLEGYAGEPMTVIHGDARLDNMFFGDDGSLALVDWQMAMRAPGNSDLVYFVATNLTPEMRRRHERELLDRYRERMLAVGASGRGLTEDGLRRGYREGVLFWCVSMGSSVLTLDSANERGAALLDALVERLYLAADDLDCGEVLG